MGKNYSFPNIKSQVWSDAETIYWPASWLYSMAQHITSVFNIMYCLWRKELYSKIYITSRCHKVLMHVYEGTPANK